MDWRQLTEVEKAFIVRLLTENFSGKESIAKQVATARVRTIDAEGSLSFEVSSSELAVVKHRIPVEAESFDRDGVPIHMLLHVVDGKVSELEFYKDDSSPILEYPSVDHWNVFVLDG